MTLEQREEFQRKAKKIDDTRHIDLPVEPIKERNLLWDLTSWLITGGLTIGGLIFGWLALPWLLEMVPAGRPRYYAFLVYAAFVRVMVAIVMTRHMRNM